MTFHVFQITFDALVLWGFFCILVYWPRSR